VSTSNGVRTSEMATRREFFRLVAQSATATMLAENHIVAAEQNGAHRLTARCGRPLLDLQQRFVDLRFGMFLHFNMATFQDREWGDPTSPADLFHPTALDTDQWAAAGQSANMAWGCLTTRHHDGFCIWPTRTEAASVGQASHSIDVVSAYVNSFRKAGLRVGLYYSILSLRDDIRHFNITPPKI
jgi:alpha-L-fucosidase